MSFSQTPNEIILLIIQYSLSHKKSFAWIFIDRRTNQICKDNDLIHLMKEQSLTNTIRISNCGNRLDVVSRYPNKEIVRIKRFKSVNHNISLFSNKSKTSDTLEYFLSKGCAYQDGKLISLTKSGYYEIYDDKHKLIIQPFNVKIVKRDVVKTIRLYDNDIERYCYKFRDGILIEYRTDDRIFKVYYNRENGAGKNEAGENEVEKGLNYINFRDNGLVDLLYNNGAEKLLVVNGYKTIMNLKGLCGCISPIINQTYCNHNTCFGNWMVKNRIPVTLKKNVPKDGRFQILVKVGKSLTPKEYKNWQKVEIV